MINPTLLVTFLLTLQGRAFRCPFQRPPLVGLRWVVGLNRLFYIDVISLFFGYDEQEVFLMFECAGNMGAVLSVRGFIV